MRTEQEIRDRIDYLKEYTKQHPNKDGSDWTVVLARKEIQTIRWVLNHTKEDYITIIDEDYMEQDNED